MAIQMWLWLSEKIPTILMKWWDLENELQLNTKMGKKIILWWKRVDTRIYNLLVK